MQERQRDYRPTWKLDQTEPVAGNFFPVNTALAIKDERAQLTVLTDASQAGTGSILDGTLELMAHRRLLHDDHRGVHEPLNETESVYSYAIPGPDWDPDDKPYGVVGLAGAHHGPQTTVRGRYLLTLAPPSKAAATWRPLQDRLYIPAAPFFSSGSVTGSYSALTSALPANVQLVTLEPVKQGSVLVRLAHQFGLHEDQELSKPVTVDLMALFAGRRISAVQEQALSGTKDLEEVSGRKVSWAVDGEGASLDRREVDDQSFHRITLTPLQLRTFLVSFGPSEITV